jgi:hypothetical protein
LDTFEARLEGDCHSLNIFSIPRVQTHDVRVLLEAGENLLPEPAAKKLIKRPAPLADTREAAKCLAFKLWTASGFHIARATEGILQEYYKAHNNGQLPAKGAQRTWVSLCRTMLDADQGNSKLLNDVKIVGETYRNPLIHPEHSLDEIDAPLLLSACVGAITKMISALP